MIPDEKKSLTTYADPDWCGGWNLEEAELDEATAKSRSGYVILFMNCILLFSSKFQTLVTLSTTEAEYVALSESLRETIPVMNLIEEIKLIDIGSYRNKSEVKCTAFEDNSGALELAMVPKIRLCTRHINNKYHHFRLYVRDGMITVKGIGTKEQIADIFSKTAGPEYVSLPTQETHALVKG